MKRVCCLFFVLAIGVNVVAQQPAKPVETEVTTIKTETVVVDSGADLTWPQWLMNDAVPVDTCTVDLRLRGWWETAGFPANNGDSDDDFVAEPVIVWGFAEDWELWVRNQIWLGDAGNRNAFQDGNYDTWVGLMWRFSDQNGYWPALALQAEGRFPTGDGSSGVDGELRLNMTNEYDSGLRSHVNIFGMCVDGNNSENVELDDDDALDFLVQDDSLEDRDIQYGLVVGLDGPLGDSGCVRWVADYMNRSSYYTGRSNMNVLELGLEWKLSDESKLAIGGRAGLDDNEDTLNFGFGATYSYTVRYGS
jgi:hypothetical protein